MAGFNCILYNYSAQSNKADGNKCIQYSYFLQNSHFEPYLRNIVAESTIKVLKPGEIEILSVKSAAILVLHQKQDVPPNYLKKSVQINPLYALTIPKLILPAQRLRSHARAVAHLARPAQV